MTVKELKEYLADKNDNAEVAVFNSTVNGWVYANKHNLKIIE